jgi:hypothetical protein
VTRYFYFCAQIVSEGTFEVLFQLLLALL